MEYLLTGAEMSDCDRRTSEEIGIPSLVLMERAALSVADGAETFLRQCGGRQPRVLAVAGRGNNGADALATGRILLERGYKVRFCRLSGEISPGSSFAVQEKILQHYGAEIVPFPDFTDRGPDPDLVIRTSGEQRLSNYLLYQCAYAEFLFPTVLWPDFSLADYHQALDAFAKRDRRYGGRNS